MRHARQLFLVLALAAGLVPSPSLAEGPSGAPAARAPAEGPRPPAVAARQPASERKDAPRRPAARPKGKRAQPQADRPVATFPGFRMLPDGSSRVFVQVSAKVDVAESKAEGRLVYRIKGAQAIQTNRYPLVTAFFATPVSQVQLVDRGKDLDVVIDLRARTDATYQIAENEGGIVLQVDFPPAAVDPRTAPSAERRPARSARGRGIAAQPGDDQSSAGF